MSTLTPDQWQEVSPYLDEVLEIDPENRAAWLRSLGERDARLASMVQSLLDDKLQLEQRGFLERPVLSAGPRLTGQRVGAYTLISQIGQGGMGSVWLARRSDGRFERQAAVKFVNFALTGPATEERFKREGTILGRLTHPHIAALMDAGISTDGSPYLVLEYVGGGIDLTGPFFQSLGTNGRSCGTCHVASDGMSVSAGDVQQRFLLTQGNDPIFRTVDGSNCDHNIDVSTFQGRYQAYSLLRTRA